MKKVFTLFLALVACICANAQGFYMVGDAVPCGWDAGKSLPFTQVDETTYQWVGDLKVGGEGFKILTSPNWNNDYHPNEAGAVIDAKGVMSSSDIHWEGDDSKWTVSQDGQYKLTIKIVGEENGHRTFDLVCEKSDISIEIGTAEEFAAYAAIAQNFSSVTKAVLTADIDFSAYKSTYVAGNYLFAGHIDGQGHTLTLGYDVTRDQDGENHVALIRYGRDCVVENLLINGSITTDKNLMGGIVGSLKGYNSVIRNVVVDLEMNSTFDGDGTHGGLISVGESDSEPTIENVAFVGSINAPQSGGTCALVGYSHWGDRIHFKNSYVSGVLNIRDGQVAGRNGEYFNDNCYTTITDRNMVNDDDRKGEIVTAEEVANGGLLAKLNANGVCWYQQVGVDAYPLPFEKAAPEPEWTLTSGDYVIQNVETGYYLGGGNDWGTHASLLGKPQWFTLEGADGVFTLDSHQYNNATAHFLAAGLYVDGASTPWTFTFAEDGTCTIENAGNYIAGNGKNAAIKTVTDATDAAAQWRLITMDDIVAAQAGATIDNPVDVTAFIVNPEFKRNANTSFYPTWTVTGADGTGTPSNLAYGSGGNAANCAESYHANNGFDLSQFIENMKPGVYRLDAHAFYRQDGSDNDNLPYVYARVNADEETSELFPLRTGTENSMAAAYASFLAGNYAVNPIYVEVTEDGGRWLKVGVHGETNGNLWNIWGEFGLTYYGEVSLADVLLNDYIKELASLKEEGAALTAKMGAAEASALEAALEAAPEKTVEAYNAAINTLKDAISAAKISINVYESAPVVAEYFVNRANNAGVDIEADIVAFNEAFEAGTLDVSEGNPIQNAYDQAVAEAIAGAEEVAGVIVNASFDEGGNGAPSTWVRDGGMHLAGNTNFPLYTGTNFVEQWVAGPGTLPNGSLSQTVTLPAGEYMLTVEAQNLQQGDASVNPAGFFIFAGDVAAEISNIADTYAVRFVVEEEGEVTLGAKTEDCTGNWISFDNFKLYALPYVPEPIVTPALMDGEEEITLSEHIAVSIEKAEALKVTFENMPQVIGGTYAINEMNMGEDEDGIFWTVGAEVAVGEINLNTIGYAEFENALTFEQGKKYQLSVTAFENYEEPAEIVTYTYEFNGAYVAPINYIVNGDFAEVGELASGATDRYAVGEPWVSNVAFANMGIRVMASEAATEGGNVLVWRGSGNGNYISQPVAVEAGKAYEVTFNQVASGNANADFNVGIGTEAGKIDVAATTVRLGTNNDGIKTATFYVPEGIEAETFYFTFSNTATNTASSGNDPVSQIDYIKMYEVDALPIAKAAAIAALPAAGEGIFAISQEAYDEAKAAIEAAETMEELNSVFVLAPAACNGEYTIKNVTAEGYLGSNEAGNVIIAEEAVTTTFEMAPNGGFYIKAGEVYINMKGGNTWSMSADAEAKTAWNFVLADGKYTIAGPNGLIGADNATAGSTCYGNKKIANNGEWIIEEFVAPAISEVVLMDGETEIALNGHSAVSVEKADAIVVTFGNPMGVTSATYAIYPMVAVEGEEGTTYMPGVPTVGEISVNTVGYAEFAETMTFNQGIKYQVEIVVNFVDETQESITFDIDGATEAAPLEAVATVVDGKVVLTFAEGTDLGDNYTVKPYIMNGETQIEIDSYIITAADEEDFFAPQSIIILTLNEEGLEAGNYTVVLPEGMFIVNGGDNNAEMSVELTVETATGIKNVAKASAKNGKFVKGNNIVIVKNGKEYNVNGILK